ncbi:30S ribosomal protein S2 [Patescibacteria group bacterium]
MAIKVSAEELLKAGAHYGHQAKRWNPKMKEYLYGTEDGVHVFDLIKTKALLEEALEFISKSVSEGKKVLLLGTKKQIKDKVIKVAKETESPYISERWLGGTFSNFNQIKRSIKKLIDMKEKKALGEYKKFTKKERLLIQREIERLGRFFEGIIDLQKIPEVIFIIDTHKESSAVKEANMSDVKIIGIVDSNSDPTVVDYPIPMNDDASKALDYVLDLVKEAILEGKKEQKTKKEVKKETKKEVDKETKK